MSVTTLLSMPLAEGLFAQAIAQSGAAAHTLTKDVGRMVGGYLADALGVPPDRESIKAVPLDKLVRAASDLVVEVQTAPDPASWGQLTLSLLPFAPTVDGSVLPAAPLASIAAGQGGTVPLLIGSNRDEARLFLVAAATIDLVDDPTLAAVAGAYGLAADDLAVYRANRPGASAGDIAGRRDHRLVLPHPAHPGRRGPGRGGHEQHLDVPVRPPGTARQPRASAPATGSRYRSRSTRPPARSIRPLIGDTPSQAVADQAHRVWVDFITRGDPGWAPYDTARRTTGLLTEHHQRGGRPGRRRTRPAGTASASPTEFK